MALCQQADLLRLPGQPSQAVFISQCYAVLGDLENALDWARQAADQGIVPHIALSCYANVLAQLNRVDEAVMAIEKIKETVPRFRIRASINAYRRVFASEEARQAVTAGLEKMQDMGYE